jgi:D-alanine-D-alanine ligase
MAGKINVAIFSAKNSKTSTSSNSIVLTLLGNLDPLVYRVSLVLIDSLLPASFRLTEEQLKNDPSYIPFAEVENHANLFHIYDLAALSIAEMKELFDIAIIAVHNDFGEDGRLDGLLATAGLPYLGSQIKTTALCFDKELTKKVMRGSGINVPKGFEIHERNYNALTVNERIQKELSYPIIIKTTSCGASRGVALVQDINDLAEATENAFRFNKDCIVEEYLKGREFAVGVTGHHLQPHALPVAEIIAHKEFFDYEAKYVKGRAEEVCPAPIEDSLRVKLQDTAIRAYHAVKADGQAKIDMMVKDDTVYVLEINTLPSLLPVSLFPQELRAEGISLSSYLDSSIKEKLPAQ